MKIIGGITHTIATGLRSAASAAVKAVTPAPRPPRRRDGERWIDPTTGLEMEYWPDQRAAEEPLNFLELGGAKRALERLRGRRPR